VAAVYIQPTNLSTGSSAIVRKFRRQQMRYESLSLIVIKFDRSLFTNTFYLHSNKLYVFNCVNSSAQLILKESTESPQITIDECKSVFIASNSIIHCPDIAVRRSRKTINRLSSISLTLQTITLLLQKMRKKVMCLVHRVQVERRGKKGNQLQFQPG
jgi:hypothetical protein